MLTHCCHRRAQPAIRPAIGLLALAAAVALAPGCGDDGDAAPAADTRIGDTAEEADTTPQDDTATDGSEDNDGAMTDTAPTVTCPAPTGARPAARSEHAAIYDGDRHRVLLFGGSFGVPQNCSAIVNHTFESDLWAYDIACDHWRRVDAPNGPAGRVRHVAVHDSAGDRMLVYGGRSRVASSGPYTLYGDVMAFDLTAETWSAVPTTGTAPAPRFNTAAAHDPVANRMIMMGGNTSANALVYTETNDTWALDLGTGAWTRIQPSGPVPRPRFWHSAIWDELRGWFIVFGGADNASAFNPSARYFADVWALDVNAEPPAWYQLDVEAFKPMGRFWSGFVRDPIHDRYVLFGGHDDQGLGNTNDVWALSPATGAWTLLAEGDVANAPPTGFCQFPPDFTLVDHALPERRHAGVFVSGAGKAWLSGGKTDCGSVDDVFEYDFTTGVWDELVTATVGEVCLRKGGLNCNDMCF